MAVKKRKRIVTDAIVRDINAAAGPLTDGSITLTVHKAKIAQIEVVEKNRCDDAWELEQGGGI